MKFDDFNGYRRGLSKVYNQSLVISMLAGPSITFIIASSDVKSYKYLVLTKINSILSTEKERNREQVIWDTGQEVLRA